MGNNASSPPPSPPLSHRPPTPSSNTRRKNVTFAAKLGQDGDDQKVAVEHHKTTDAVLLQRLEQENEILRDRCDRLEAQAILVSVQLLDVVARATAWSLYLSTLYLLIRLATFFLWQYMSALEDQLIQYLYHQLCWNITCELTCQVQFQCQEPPAWILPVLQWLWSMAKVGVGVSLLHMYHRRTHGLDLRRCHVFAVALIMFARIKLCRERERMFMTKPRKEDTTDHVDHIDQDEAHKKADANDTNNTTTAIKGFGETMAEDAIWDANYEVSARFLYVSFLQLRGLWTKTAQYLSSRADFVPTSYVRELSKLQDQAPATAWKDLMRAGIVPTSLLRILEIDPIPIASASIGQVHVAHYKTTKSTGDKVVVKLQHPAATLLLDDFSSLAWICRIWSWLEPEYKFFEILMQEWATEARKELDFLQEAQNLADAQITLEQWKMMKQSQSQDKTTTTHFHFVTTAHSIPYQVEIPQPILSLCSRKVLVMSYCEGVRIDKWTTATSAIPKEDVMESVAQTFAHFMYNGTIFNGDPHPGNLFLRPGMKQQQGSTRSSDDGDDNANDNDDGATTKGFTLVLLDWGLAKRLPPTKRIAFAQMAFAAATIDFGLLLDSFDQLGLKMKREDVHQDMDAIRFLLRELAPRILARRRIKAKLRYNQAKLQAKKKGERVPVESKAYPGEFFFFVRVNELLHGLGSRLQVQMNYLDIIKPFAERALLQANVNGSTKDSIPIDPLVMVDKELNTKVANVLQQLEATNQIAGAQVCVLDANGNALVDLAAGHMGGYLRQHAMRHDTLVLGFSCTKAVTATLAHVMVAEGYLTPDEPICERVWPNFCPLSQAPPALIAALHDADDTFSQDDVKQQWLWKRKITLRHILTHTAGLWTALPPRLTIQRLSSCESCVAAFEYDPLHPQDTILPSRAPGVKGEYHFLSFGWLVAGVLCGAYRERHGKTCTFAEVYQAILLPKLSAVTLSTGFQPNGSDSSSDSLALVEIDDSNTRFVLQVEREAESMGDDSGVTDSSDEQKRIVGPLLPALEGREFLIDPRIWNCKTARGAVCPAAGGRFSARGLAFFYHDVVRNGILSKDRVEWASSPHMVLDHVAQGQTMMRSNPQSELKTVFGLGYQLIRFDESAAAAAAATPTAFGHAGVGGSVGFHHKPSGVSVAVMLNKANVDKEVTKKIVAVIAEHFGW